MNMFTFCFQNFFLAYNLPRGQRLAGLASETQEYPSLDSNHSIEELFVHETTQDVFQDPEVDEEDPLLDLLKSPGDSSQVAEQATVFG